VLSAVKTKIPGRIYSLVIRQETTDAIGEWGAQGNCEIAGHHDKQ